MFHWNDLLCVVCFLSKNSQTVCEWKNLFLNWLISCEGVFIIDVNVMQRAICNPLEYFHVIYLGQLLPLMHFYQEFEQNNELAKKKKNTKEMKARLFKFTIHWSENMKISATAMKHHEYRWLLLWNSNEE